jgi:hypothetical protein
MRCAATSLLNVSCDNFLPEVVLRDLHFQQEWSGNLLSASLTGLRSLTVELNPHDEAAI